MRCISCGGGPLWLVSLALSYWRGPLEVIGSVKATVHDASLNALPAILLALWLLFPPVTSVAFKAFECEDFDNGRSYLRADYSVECYSSEHTPTAVLGTLALLMYPLGVPCFFFLLLRSAKAAIKLNKPTRFSQAIGMLYRY